MAQPYRRSRLCYDMKKLKQVMIQLLLNNTNTTAKTFKMYTKSTLRIRCGCKETTVQIETGSWSSECERM